MNKCYCLRIIKGYSNRSHYVVNRAENYLMLPTCYYENSNTHSIAPHGHLGLGLHYFCTRFKINLEKK